VQVIDELRRGVRLKKSNHERTPIEYELTPYEILMGDIRAKWVQTKLVDNRQESLHSWDTSSLNYNDFDDDDLIFRPYIDNIISTAYL